MNDTPAVIVNIQRQPGANIIEVVDRIKALLRSCRTRSPPAVMIDILTDRTITIRASVHDVQFELRPDDRARSCLVIFLFLRNVRHDHPERRGPALARRHVRR